MRRAPTVGERGRRFTLEVPIESPDGFGGVIRTFQPGPRLWGAIELLSEKDRRRGDRPESVVTHRVTLPYRPGVTSQTRLSLGLRRFRIQAAMDPDGDRRWLECLVEEVGP